MIWTIHEYFEAWFKDIQGSVWYHTTWTIFGLVEGVLRLLAGVEK